MLIVMPAVFVLIMSLALQDTFRQSIPRPMRLVFLASEGAGPERLLAALTRENSLAVSARISKDNRADRARVRTQVREGHAALAVILGAARHGSWPGTATLYINPALPAQMRALGISLVRRAFARVATDQLASLVRRLAPRSPGAGPASLARPPRLLVAKGGLDGAPAPTSAQQNAPAWALLAMFFLTVPLSVAVIKERQQGIITRLRALPVPSWVLLAGKILPYFLINTIQLLMVLGEGMYVLPLLGGDALTVGHAPFALAVVAASANLAAIGYGLLLATFVQSQEQATSFGAVSVLIMAAIGGILVPKMVMPTAMQELSVVSPMSWGLDGFQAIFVRGDGLAGVLPDTLRLLGFGAACLIVAAVRFHRELRPQ